MADAGSAISARSAAPAVEPARTSTGPVLSPPEVDAYQPGGIETAVIAFVEALPYQAPDPRALLAQIAIKLARRVDLTGAVPAAVRELRVMLVQLVEVPNGPHGFVDEQRLRAAQRRLDATVAGAGR
jgi:hypothetical protein